MKPTPHQMPSYQHASACLDYNGETGIFTWKQRPREHFGTLRAWSVWNTRFAGKEAGTLSVYGYMQISLGGKRHFAHRLAWLMTHRVCPTAQIDHINGGRADNRISNLRAATYSENARNAKLPSHNTSGIKGVSWSKRWERWTVSVHVNDKKIHIGNFKDLASAARAANAARLTHHGEFTRHS